MLSYVATAACDDLAIVQVMSENEFRNIQSCLKCRKPLLLNVLMHDR